jgi:hypothetical protein
MQCLGFLIPSCSLVHGGAGATKIGAAAIEDPGASPKTEMTGPSAPEMWPEAGTDPAGGVGARAGAGATVSGQTCAPRSCTEVGIDPEVDVVMGAPVSGQT